MSNSDNKLYSYQDLIDIVYTTDSYYVDNRTMDTRNLKLHKGVSNELIFNIRDRDRKLQNVFPETLRAYILDPSTKARLVTRILQNTSDIGKVKLCIDEGDIQNIEPGLYKMYVTKSNVETANAPLYTDQNNSLSFNVQITDEAGSSPIPTQTQNTFTQTSSTSLGDDANIFVTNALTGNLSRNFPNAQHTVAFYLDGYTGNITIQASCMQSTPDLEDQSTDWFDVETVPVANANVSIAHTNFTVNCNWIRIVSEPDTGSITQVLLRN